MLNERGGYVIVPRKGVTNPSTNEDIQQSKLTYTLED